MVYYTLYMSYYIKYKIVYHIISFNKKGIHVYSICNIYIYIYMIYDI